MKTLFADIENLSFEIANLTQELEDRYESPRLSKQLKHFRSRLRAYQSYKVAYTEENPEKRENEIWQVYAVLERCKKALAALETVTAKSNPFDIIEVLRSVYVDITQCLGDPDEEQAYLWKFYESMQ